jgi:molybdenum cofactor guanylyltransferase
MDISDITGVILAGGRGTRMGGEDKGLLPLAGKPMIAHVIDRLAPQVATLIISANRNLDAYRQFGLPVISDRIPGFGGPLAGLHSALSTIHTDWLISVPCDTPYVPVDYVPRMCTAIDRQPAGVVHDGTRLQAGFCLLHRDLLPQLTAALDAQEFAVHRFLHKVHAVHVNFSDEADAFRNINTPEELAQAQTVHDTQ